MEVLGRLRRTWDQLVELGALAIIVSLALAIMVRVVETSDALKHMGIVLLATVLLIQLPAIIVGIWLTLSVWQHLGIAIVGALAVVALLGFRGKRRGSIRKARPHADS